MTCAETEILLAEYVDGTLPGGDKAAVEEHLASCQTCAELAHDAAGAVAFLERAADVEPPAELVTRILFEVSHGPSRAVVKPPLARRLFGRVFGDWLSPVLQPRFAMGMAMTVLSFAMLGRVSGVHMRQLKPADLDPVKVWTSAEDRVARSWERGMKYYDSLRLVFEIQTRLKEWSDEQPGTGKSGDAGRAPSGEPK